MKLCSFLVLVCVATAVAIAHAGPPEPMAITKQRNAASAFALGKGLTIAAMARACTVVPDAGARFARAERQWMIRNRDYLVAARWWLDHVKDVAAAQEGPEGAQVFDTMTSVGLSGRAAMEAAQALGSQPDAAGCRKWADIIDTGQDDLDRETDASELMGILAYRDAVAAWHDHAVDGNAEDRTHCVEGWNLAESGDYPRALRAYESCIRDGHLSDATLARTYRNIGIAYRAAKDPLKAVAAYDKAIALKPADVAGDYINRANAYDEANDFEKAMADYAEALKMDPDSGEAYYNRGIAYEHNHMLENAKADFIAAYGHGLRTQLLYDRLVHYDLVSRVR